MILLSELSRRRIRSITKLIRVGRVEFVVVLRVDKEKGYIDLSKRRVAPEDVVKADKKYTKAKAVHSLLRHIAQVRHVKLEDLYKQIAWPLARQFGHAYEAFKLAIIEPDKVFSHLPDVAADLKDLLQKEILERLTPQAVRVRADVEATCFAYAGYGAPLCVFSVIFLLVSSFRQHRRGQGRSARRHRCANRAHAGQSEAAGAAALRDVVRGDRQRGGHRAAGEGDFASRGGAQEGARRFGCQDCAACRDGARRRRVDAH